MAYTTINKSSDHFDGKIYLGSSSAVTVTGLEFQPDWVWIKDRDNGNNHCLVDAVRGVGKYIQSDNTSAEVNNSTNSISAFTSDGFTTGTGNPANESASTTKGFMSWNWLGANGTTSNTDGSITSNVSANTTSGFSIVSYTGNGTSGATIGHGLSSAPSMIIFKSRSASNSWLTYHKSIGATKYLRLEETDAEAVASSVLNDTAPTSSIITLGDSSGVNANGVTFIAYCFAEKKGYSKFSSYVGNGSSDGTMIWTGFSPSFVMTKNTETASQWTVWDNKRSAFNLRDKILYANASNAEATATAESVDFLSNGFKIRGSNSGINTHNQKYIFMAFAEAPLVGSNNVPCTAR